MLVAPNSPPQFRVPHPLPGAAPIVATALGAARPDAVGPPVARPSTPISAPPRHLVDGTPEVLSAALALGTLAVGAEVTLVGAASALRSAGSYASRLASGIVRCISDPVTTGEHIAEGVVGGAAWAGAAAGVSALADAARSHVVAAHATPR